MAASRESIVLMRLRLRRCTHAFLILWRGRPALFLAIIVGFGMIFVAPRLLAPRPSKRRQSLRVGRSVVVPLEATPPCTGESAWRVGNDGEGGWWACRSVMPPLPSDVEPSFDPAPKKCVVYSFGIRDDFSFDKAIASRGCEVHGFDPSPDGLASEPRYKQEVSGGSYHAFGVGGEDKIYPPGKVPFEWPGMGYLTETNTEEWQLFRIDTVMSKLEHKKVHVLKMDVEGTEWAVLGDITHNPRAWDQLLIELHFPPMHYEILTAAPGGGFQVRHIKGGEERPDRVGMLRRLAAVARLWRWERNGRDCIEASFIRRGLLDIDSRAGDATTEARKHFETLPLLG